MVISRLFKFCVVYKLYIGNRLGTSVTHLVTLCLSLLSVKVTANHILALNSCPSGCQRIFSHSTPFITCIADGIIHAKAKFWRWSHQHEQKRPLPVLLMAWPLVSSKTLPLHRYHQLRRLFSLCLVDRPLAGHSTKVKEKNLVLWVDLLFFIACDWYIV